MTDARSIQRTAAAGSTPTIPCTDPGLFGLPTTLSAKEADALTGVLISLWTSTYRQAPATLGDDVQLCRRFFDPVARGARLREELACLAPSPATPPSVRHWLTEPLAVRVDGTHLLVGVEARIALSLLEDVPSGAAATFSDADLASAYKTLAVTYRGWARHRLDQVIALRAGAAKEVMQAIAVGFVIALLVNRSTAPERALQVTDIERTTDSVDRAVFAAADAFARRVSERNKRSQAQYRIKSGYGVSEARRRLGELLAGTGDWIYIAPNRKDDVVTLLARDLARRTRLNAAALGRGFDDLVETYRRTFIAMALTVPSHERPADTIALREQLLQAFTRAQGRSS